VHAIIANVEEVTQVSGEVEHKDADAVAEFVDFNSILSRLVVHDNYFET
jgi:hypothetical protein